MKPAAQKGSLATRERVSEPHQDKEFDLLCSPRNPKGLELRPGIQQVLNKYLAIEERCCQQGPTPAGACGHRSVSFNYTQMATGPDSLI